MIKKNLENPVPAGGVEWGVAILITSADLKSQAKSDLARMAKDRGVDGWRSMSKDQLVRAIAKSGAKSSKVVVSRGKATKPVIKVSSRNTVTSAKSITNGKSVGKVGKKTAKTVKQAELQTKIGAKKAKKLAAEPSKSKKTAPVGKAKIDLRKHSVSKAKQRVATNGVAHKIVGSRLSIAKPVKKSPVPVEKSKAKLPGVKPAKKQEPPTNPKVLERIRQLQLEKESNRDLAFRPVSIASTSGGDPTQDTEPKKDRVALIVRDPFWLHASWDLTRQCIERAKAAMAEQWHTAKPVLRLLRLDGEGTTNTSETVERDISIHGGVRNWYVDLDGMPGRFRVLIGYLSSNGRFHTLVKSNIVNTPAPGSADAVDNHWTDIAVDSEKFFALSGGYNSEQETGELQEVFEHRLKRSMGTPALARFGSGAQSGYGRRDDFHFDMEVELLVFGSTVSDAYLTLSGEPIKLNADGTFHMRLPFPDRRQVLPAVACSRDGVQQRTIVVAVERNTKVMEPLSSEQEEPA